MEKDKPKKKRTKKAAAEGEGSGEKEHKPNWRETRATYEDIQRYLSDLIHLRHNVITGQQEFRVPEMDPFSLLAQLYPTGATPLDEWRSADTWQTVNDRLEFVSTLEIMEKVGGLLAQRLTTNKLGHAMTALGFESMRSRGQRGYVVIGYEGDEIKANKALLAFEAKPESESTSVTASEIFATNDTIF